MQVAEKYTTESLAWLFQLLTVKSICAVNYLLGIALRLPGCFMYVKQQNNIRWHTKDGKIHKGGGGVGYVLPRALKLFVYTLPRSLLKQKYSGNTIYCNECLQTSNLAQKLRAVLMHRLLIPRRFVVSQSSCLRQKLCWVLTGLVCRLSE